MIRIFSRKKPPPGPTPIYHRISRRLDEEYTRLKRDKITHWLMRLHRHGTDIDDCRGRRIRIQGAKFDGSTRDLYWSFMRPCLEDIIDATFREAETEGKNYRPTVAAQALDEAAGLLKRLVTKVYRRMVRVDQLLRGEGYPERVVAYDASGHVAQAHGYIDAMATSLREHAPPPGALRRFVKLCHDNGQITAAVVGAIGFVLAALWRHWLF